MLNKINRFLDVVSDFLAHRKGLLPFMAVALITINAVLQFIPGNGWIVESDLLLHIGIIMAIIGFMLAWTL